MTANGNRWTASVLVSDLYGNTDKAKPRVCYYFSATSKKDKTVTKPFNALNGGYYVFALDNTAEYNVDMFDFNTTPMPMDSITFPLGTNWLVEDTSKEADTPTGITTGISEVKPQLQNAHDEWYSIGGSRLGVRPTTKGVYIRNGKKMVVK